MKIPIIKKEEYDIWSMRMRQYICHTDHNLWDLIVDGDLQEEGERVKSILLLAIPDEYLLKFHNVPDAKSPWAAIKSRVYEDEMKRSSSSTSNSQNLAFLSSENTSSTNEVSTASGDFRVNTAGGTSSSSLVSSTPCADEVAILTVRVKKFIQKIGRNLDFKGKQPVGFDKSIIECYNRHRTGHFARECKSRRNQGKRSYGDNGRRNAPTNESSSQALVAQDGLGGYD
ncbi:hypothetical protein Tco_0488195 [Tanacetum coccineum]